MKVNGIVASIANPIRSSSNPSLMLIKILVPIIVAIIVKIEIGIAYCHRIFFAFANWVIVTDSDPKEENLRVAIAT